MAKLNRKLFLILLGQLHLIPSWWLEQAQGLRVLQIDSVTCRFVAQHKAQLHPDSFHVTTTPEAVVDFHLVVAL